MKTEDAINHLIWKFTKNGSKKDKESLNVIIEMMNKQDDNLITDNLNFCKLFIYCFKSMCIRSATRSMPEFKIGMTEKEFKTFKYESIDYRSIYSRLRGIMMVDADSHVDSLLSELQGIEMQMLVNNNNLTAKTIMQLTTKEEVGSKMRKMLKEFIINNK